MDPTGLLLANPTKEKKTSKGVIPRETAERPRAASIDSGRYHSKPNTSLGRVFVNL
jgi:hypothetical protein